MSRVMEDRISDVANLFADSLSGAAKDTGRYVRDNPWAAAGVVALVGAAAALFMSRRRRAAGSGAVPQMMGG